MHAYGKLPRFPSVVDHDFPDRITVESKGAASDVAVWGIRSLLTHTTESPTRTVNVLGLKLVASIVTVCVAGARAVVSQPFFFSWDCRCFACSRCATNAGRTFTSSALSSALAALGISVLSTASSTCW